MRDKKPNTLFNSFKKAAQFVWCVYFWPDSVKGLGVAILLQQSIHYGIGSIMYPDIKDYLVQSGFDQKTASTLSPTLPNIVIPLPQNRTWKDHVFALTEAPTIFGVAFGFYNSISINYGYARSIIGCTISVEASDNIEGKNDLSSYILAKKEDINDIPYLNNLLSTHIILHEKGHCKPLIPFVLGPAKALLFAFSAVNLPTGPLLDKLKQLEMSDELYSDNTSLKYMHMAHDFLSDQQIKEFVLNFRAVAPQHVILPKADYAHDLVLPLYAEINNLKPPSLEDIIASKQELSSLVRKKFEDEGVTLRGNFEWQDLLPQLEKPQIQSSKFVQKLAQTVSEVLSEQQETLNPWTKIRAELYLSAIQYFVSPSVIPPFKKEGITLPSPL